MYLCVSPPLHYVPILAREAPWIPMHNTLKICLLFSAVISPVCAHLHNEVQTNNGYHYQSPDNIKPFNAIEHDEEYYGVVVIYA